MTQSTSGRARMACALFLAFLSLAVTLACGGDPTDSATPTRPDASLGVDPLGASGSLDAGGDAATAPMDAGADGTLTCPVCPVGPIADAAAPADSALPPTSLPPWFYGDAGRSLVWIAEGDSMTHPNNADASDNVWMYPQLAGFLLGPSVHVTNIAAAGDTLSNMLAQEPYMHTLLPDGGACVISVLAGTNDLRTYDASVGDVCSWYEAYGEGAHALGCKFVALTLPAPDNFIDASARDQVDDCVRHLAAADAVVDLAADPELAKMTIGDGTHPDKQGHERMAQHVAPAIRDALLDAGAKLP